MAEEASDNKVNVRENAERQGAMQEAPKQEAPAQEQAAPKARGASRRSPRGAAKPAGSAALLSPLFFGKYDSTDVTVDDPSLANYITLSPRAYPNTFGRRRHRTYYAAHTNIVERLINKMMRGGTGAKIGGRVIRTKGALQGKKLKLMHVVEQAFENISRRTGKNPLQVLVDALENAAPIEDTTRVRYGGINYNVATGISAARRLDVALRNVALSALISAFKSRKSLSEALADELVLAANKDASSYAIKRRVEAERIARSAR